MLEEKKNISKYCNAPNNNIIQHDTSIKNILPERKKEAKCAPTNYYETQDWNKLLSKTMSVNDLFKARSSLNLKWDRDRERIEKT